MGPPYRGLGLGKRPLQVLLTTTPAQQRNRTLMPMSSLAPHSRHGHRALAVDTRKKHSELETRQDGRVMQETCGGRHGERPWENFACMLLAPRDATVALGVARLRYTAGDPAAWWTGCSNATCVLKRPSVNFGRSKRMAHCKKHAQDGMVDTVGRCCSHDIPARGDRPSTSRAAYWRCTARNMLWTAW